MRRATVINYYGAQDDGKCGYCGCADTSQSHGMVNTLILYIHDGPISNDMA